MPEQNKEQTPASVFGLAVLIVLTIFIGADFLSELVNFQAGIPPKAVSVDSSAKNTGEDSNLPRNMRTIMRRDLPEKAEDETREPEDGSVKETSGQESEKAAAPSSHSVTEYETGQAIEDFSASSGRNASSRQNVPGIELEGVMMGSGVGIAVLNIDGNSYTVGAGERAGRYTVEDISKDSVTLSGDGRTFTVGITDSKPSRRIGDYPAVLPDPEDVPLPPQPMPASEPVLPGTVDMALDDYEEAGSSVSASEHALTRQEMKDFISKGAAVVSDVRASSVEGENTGVKLTFRNPDNALAKLGLKDGDIVMSCNSKVMITPEQLYNQLLTLQDAPYAHFFVIRNGQEMFVDCDFPE